MFKLQICFPETLKTDSLDYILRTHSMTQWTINSNCWYNLKKAKLSAVKLDDEWYKYSVMPKNAMELLYPQVTEQPWDCINKRIKVHCASSYT